MRPVEKNPPLFTIDTGAPEVGEIQSAVIGMFEELELEGVLGPIEKAKKAALIKAAAAVDTGFQSDVIAVATSNVFKQLMEGLESLPRPVSGTDADMDAYTATIHRITKEALSA